MLHVSHPRRRGWIRMTLGVLALATTGWSAQVCAQEFPARPIHLIVPVSPGTVLDLLARTLSAPMGRALGQSIVVENVTGTGGVVATTRVVRSPKDGYTIAITSNNHVVNPSIYKNMPFDSIKDVAALGVIGSTPLALVSNPAVPARNVRELIALAKAKPGELNYGSSGNGTVLQLANVLLVSETGIDVKHVPYKSFANMLTDLIGGQIQFGFSGVASVAEHIRSGRLRAIGISTPTRSAILPEVPTLAESGVPNYSFDAWFTLIGPAGMPKSTVDRINAAMKTALAQKEVQDILASNGITAIGGSPESATALLQSELEKHAQLVKRSGATLE